MAQDDELTLYHGTGEEFRGGCIVPAISGKHKTKLPKTDFGRGFYMAEDPELAVRAGAAHVSQDRILLYSITFTVEKLRKLKIIRFTEPDLKWLMLVAYNRGRLTEEMCPKFVKSMLAALSDVDII